VFLSSKWKNEAYVKALPQKYTDLINNYGIIIIIIITKYKVQGEHHTQIGDSKRCNLQTIDL